MFTWNLLPGFGNQMNYIFNSSDGYQFVEVLDPADISSDCILHAAEKSRVWMFLWT